MRKWKKMKYLCTSPASSGVQPTSVIKIDEIQENKHAKISYEAGIWYDEH